MRVLNALAAGLLVAATAFPQAQMSSGDIKGTVTDTTNAVIPGARVTTTNMETGVARVTTTDAAGYFRFFVLPPANYELKVEATGFSVYTRRPVPVTIG